MNKIKSFIKEASKQLVVIYKRFPISMLIIAFITIIGYIQLQFDVFNGRTFERILMIFLITCPGTLVVESFDKKRSPFTYIGCTLALVIGYVFYKLLNLEVSSSEVRIYENWLVAYMGSLALGFVYILNKKSGQEIKKYLLGTFSNGLQVGIYYGVFCLGTLLLYGIIYALFTKGGSDVYFNLLELTFGLIFVPFAIGCFTDIKEEIAGFLKGLIKYVLFPIAVIATILIYVYFAKIFISQDIPSNQIFPIIATLFVTAFPVLIISNEFNKETDNKNRLNRMYGLVYIPFILMEIYSMGVRVGDYGLTVPRYMAFAYVAMQIVLIGLILFKDSKYLDKFLLAGIIAVIIITVSPINAEKVSIMSQKNRFNKAMEVLDAKGLDALTREELQAIYNPYQYIIRYEDSFKDERVTRELQEKLYENHSYEYHYNDYDYKYYHQRINGFDTSNYSRMYEVDFYGGSSDNEVRFKSNEDNLNVTIDMSKIKDVMNQASERNENFGIIIPTDDAKYDFYFTNINLRINNLSGDIESISNIGGYVFEKIGE